MKSICVFCGSSYGALEAYADIARETGRAIAEQGYTLVYGGAKVGLMGTVADAALAAGGKVIGVLPRSLQDKEIGHEGLSELHLVDSMHERKAMMADLSDAFIALPGGVGTLEEIFEVWTWGQLGYHKKPCGFLNAEGLLRSPDRLPRPPDRAGFHQTGDARHGADRQFSAGYDPPVRKLYSPFRSQMDQPGRDLTGTLKRKP